MTKPLVIYHARCTDGFTAAWVAARALGDVELFEGFYGQDPPDVTGREVYILDFSYKRPLMEKLRDAASSLIVLDHHVSAKDDLEGLLPPVSKESKSGMTFDMNRSGARLAWDFFYSMMPPPQRPWLIDYTEDRDLWRWALPMSRAVSAGIELVPKTLDDWDELAMRSIDNVADQGEIIERYRKICIEAAAGLARPGVIAGHVVPCANSSEMRFASDVAHVLAEGQPFAATYWVRADGKVQFSLRSREDGMDVSVIVKQLGGGGHAHAAGFEIAYRELAGILCFSS